MKHRRIIQLTSEDLKDSTPESPCFKVPPGITVEFRFVGKIPFDIDDSTITVEGEEE